jgi:hypothetical protein
LCKVWQWWTLFIVFKNVHANLWCFFLNTSTRDVITVVFGWKCPSGRPFRPDVPPASAFTCGRGKNRVRADTTMRPRGRSPASARMHLPPLPSPLPPSPPPSLSLPPLCCPRGRWAQGCHKGCFWRKITVRTSFSSGRPRLPRGRVFTVRRRGKNHVRADAKIKLK